MRTKLSPLGFLRVFLLLSLAASGCSFRQTAAGFVGDAITSGNGEVYASDNDPDLVRDALPFGLKTYESLLSVTPDHKGLLLASAQGFVVYAYMIGQDADRLNATDVAGARSLRERSFKLFLRGRDYAMRGLEVAHPGFAAAFKQDAHAAVSAAGKEDEDYLYWCGVGWLGAISARKGDPALIADLPNAGALVARVLDVDEAYRQGAAEELFVTYEGSRPGGSEQAARLHYQRALQLSQGHRASVYLALAEAISIRDQNLPEFRKLLQAALAVDPDKVPALRLANTLAIRRANWLEQRIPELFVAADVTE
jgi:hypothetical protein